MSIEKEPESDSAEQHSTGSTIGHGGDDDVTMPPRPREFAATATPPVDEATLAPEIFAGQANVGDRIRYFGDYELVEEIARGGMGVVFRARQVNLNRVVALKMILAGQFAGQQDVQRFYTEAEAAAKLDHPGIVPIFEIGEHQGQHYFSMGFIEGQSLADKVKDGPLPPREAAELVKSICEAMAYAHERGVIHRDLKPANILIDTNGRPKVTDFGLAKKTEADSQLTGTGQILGTPAYMPPEQASGKTDEVGVPADVYALGAILYCLLTGRPPFQAANPMDTLLQVLEKEPVAPRTLNSLIDRDLETICLKCLEKHAARRYLSAAELGDELNRYLQHEPIRARPVGSVERTWRWCKRNPGIAALSAVLVLLVTGATIGSILVAYREARLAESEFEARSFAEDARREAEKQERAAVQSRDEANQLLVRQYISNGLRLQDDDDGAAALLWFIEALKLDQQNRARSRIHRLRLAKAFEKLPDITRANYLHERIFKTEVSQDRSVATTVEYGDGELINRVWDLQEYRVLNLTAPISSRNEFASMNWDGSLLAVCAENGIELYDRDALRTGQPLQTFPQLVSTACALSPDGKFLATAGAPSVSDTLLAAAGGKLARPGIVLWELDSGKRLHELQTAIAVTALTFSPDGRFLAAGSEVREDVVQVWNTESGQQVRSPLLPKSKAWGLKFSPDASQLLAVSDEAIRVWSLDAETPARELKSYRGMIDAAWDSEGQRVITGCSDRTARIWDARTGKQLVGPLQHASEIVSVAFSPTSEYVATGSTDRTARVWDAKSGVPITPPLRHSNFIRSVFFGADDNHLITVANEHNQGSTLRRFDLTRGQAIGEPLVREADTDVASISDLTFGKQGKILTGLSRGKASIWWIGDKLAAPRQLKIDGTQITSVAIHPDEQTIATGDDRGWVTLWHAEDGRPLQEFRNANGGNSGGLLGSLLGRQKQLDPSVSAIGFSPDGKWLAAAHGKELEIWDLATGEKTTETPISHPEVIECLRFSPGSKLLLTGCQDGAGRLFHSDSGELARTVKHDSWVLHVDFDAGGSHFLTASADFTVRIWDTQQEAKPVVVRMAGGVQQAVFSLDGKSVATACWDGRAAIASAQNGQLIVPPLQHGEHVRYVQFTPDGSMLLTRSDDGAARLWDVETGQRIAQWQPRGGSVRSAALHPSGESLAIAGDLGEVSILRLEPDDRSIEQLTTAAEILANQNIDPLGGLGRLSDTQWIQRYLSRSPQ